MVRTRKGSRHVQRLSIRWQPGPCQAASCVHACGVRGGAGTKYPHEQVWGYPLLIRASSDTGRHLSLFQPVNVQTRGRPGACLPHTYAVYNYSGRFEWVLHWAPSRIASFSSHCPINRLCKGRVGGIVCRPFREKPVSVSIASQSSALAALSH